MPAITRSRLDEIRSLAAAVGDAMARGAGTPLMERMPKLTAAVDEVNAALAEVDEMLVAGLRDEALSMHDPELVTVARMLDLRSNPDWIRLHGWLLERGQSSPAPVNVEAAEALAAALEDGQALRDDLTRLRRSALERAPLADRLETVRRLREADPTGRAWLDAVDAHEEARIRELRLAVPRALEADDFGALAAMGDELADPAWGRTPPADLLPRTAGAREAADLVAAVTEADAVAAEAVDLVAAGGTPGPREIDALAARRNRVADLELQADVLLDALAVHPEILRRVRARGLDTAIRRAAERSAAAFARIEQLAAGLKTRRDFEAACRQLEHLCDHPPPQGQESQWLADLARCDLTARAACQEIPELTMPLLLRERAQRAAATIESREQLRRRFWMVMTAAVVAGLVVFTAGVGWLVWKRGEYGRTVAELERRVAEARVGAHLDRPAIVDTIIGRYAGDTTVASLVEQFDAGVAEEKRRADAFRKALLDLGKDQETLALDVEDRGRGGADGWLEPWPASYVTTAKALADARRTGGLPDKRGGDDAAADADDGSEDADDTDDVVLSAEARRRFEAEETDLADAEARQADLDGRLARLAQEAFDERLGRIRDRMGGSPTAADARTLLREVRELRDLATADKAGGLPATAAGQRVPQEAVDTLGPLEKRLETLVGEAGGRTKGGSR